MQIFFLSDSCICHFFVVILRRKIDNTMRKTIFFICTLVLCAYAMPALSWGQKGHRIIAQIAYDHLSKKAKKQVDAVMGERGMIYWANWPDEIKSDTIYPTSYDWHFQDFDGGLSDEQIADALVHYPKEGGNLFRALDSLVRMPKTPHTLRFIVHLSGDRYCPMHMAHMDDKGGNKVKMKWFRQETNLHNVWDEKLIDSRGYSYTEYAQMLEDTYGHERAQIERATDVELLVQSYHITEAIYAYQKMWDGNTYHYIYRWHEPMEHQLYIAGIRLAKLLNELYR